MRRTRRLTCCVLACLLGASASCGDDAIEYVPDADGGKPRVFELGHVQVCPVTATGTPSPPRESVCPIVAVAPKSNSNASPVLVMSRIINSCSFVREEPGIRNERCILRIVLVPCLRIL